MPIDNSDLNKILDETTNLLKEHEKQKCSECSDTGIVMLILAITAIISILIMNHK